MVICILKDGLTRARHILKGCGATIAVAFVLLGCLNCSGPGKSTPELHSEADMSGLTLSCTTGNYYEQKFSAREDVTVFACNSESDAIQALRQGFSDVYACDEVVITSETMKRLGIKKAFRGEEAFDVAYALRKGNPELMEALNTFLASAPLEDIVDFWTNGGPAVPDPFADASLEGAPLRCISAANIDPVCYVGEGNQWKGFDADILRRFANSQGRPLKLTVQDLSAAIIALQTAQADIVSGSIFVTEERKKSVDFSVPYLSSHPGYYVQDKNNGGGMGLGKRLRMNLLTESRWKLIVDGLRGTAKITLMAILLGTLLGAGVCAAKRSRKNWLRSAAGFYGTLIQGTPTLVLLLIMFYVVFAGSGINATMIAIITFALGFASSSGNIFNNAISSVPQGQTEAGLSLGFTPFRTFIGIVFPQALRCGLPLYTGECVSLLKSTSIVGYIAIRDLTKASDLIRSRTFDALIPLLIVTILYFLLAWLLRKLLNLFLIKK